MIDPLLLKAKIMQWASFEISKQRVYTGILLTYSV